MELTMKRTLALTSLLLSAGLVSTTAQSAEFASADCVTGLNEIGQISVNNISGSPQDVERVVDMGFLMFQRFGDGLIKNLMGFGNPAEDIKAITNH